MSMSDTFHSAIAVYRAAAASAFTKLRAEKGNRQSSAIVEKPQQSFKREVFPALEQFLQQATTKFASFKATQSSNTNTSPIATTTKTRNKARAVGCSGPLVLALCADVRRQKWLVYLSEARHRLTMSMHNMAKKILPALPCGIPNDIRQRYAKLHMACKARNKSSNGGIMFVSIRKKRQFVFFTRPLGPLNVNNSQQLNVNDGDINSDVPSLIHVNRCRASLAKGAQRLLSQGYERTVRFDTAEGVRRKYAGKPDEIYRRKNSKKFAAWKRQVIDMKQKSQSRVQSAENVMRRSRGYDQLLTERSYGDTSFAPFLFDTSSHAYAFSSRITEAPKLRKAMLDKYSKQPKTLGGNGYATMTESHEPQDSLQKAHVAAETNPLFHTRVMNRFG